MRRFLAQLGTAFALLTWPAISAGHQFWIEPTLYHPEPGKAVAFNLYVGPPFKGEPFPRTPSHQVRFDLIGPDHATCDVPGIAGTSPAGFLRAPAAARYEVVYESVASVAELDRETFLKYLRDEGHIAEADRLAAEWPYGDIPVRDKFSRSAKALMVVGNPPPIEEIEMLRRPQPADLTLEIFARFDVASVRPDSEAVFEVLQDGKPVTDLPVMAAAKSGGAPLAGKTDAEGRVRFKLGEPGMWLVHAVSLKPLPAGSDAEWRSYWGSMTFEVQPQAAPAIVAAEPLQRSGL